jgi:hypothetical protein
VATVTVTDFEVGNERIEELLAPHPEIARKLERLVERRDETRGRMEAGNTTLLELRSALFRAEQDLADARDHDAMSRRKTSHKDSDSETPNDDKEAVRLRRAEARVDALKERVERSRERYKQLSAEWGAYSNAVNRVTEYLVSLPTGFDLQPFEGAVPKTLKDEDFPQAIARVRAELEHNDQAAAAVKAAPIPNEDAKRIAREQVAKLAAEGRPDISSLLKRGGSLRWPQQPLNGFNVDGMIPQLAKAVPMIAWMFGDALVEALDHEIELESSTGEEPLTDADRKFKLTELAEKRLGLEHAEEQFIERYTDEGGEIARRRGVDPRALLGLSASMPGPNTFAR